MLDFQLSFNFNILYNCLAFFKYTIYKNVAIAIDNYLLKPFSFQRFITAVSKVNDSLTTNTAITNPSIFIKESNKYYQVKIEDILFAEAFGNYVKVHLEDKTIVTHQTLTSFEEVLPEGQFVKVHKTFIIAKDKTTLIEGNLIHILQHKIPVEKMYKLNINKLLK
ncbi:MAG: LytTR family transcriptional regulator [Flavobacteriaceae bacterium]|nr:LytTR family transcriptional regulator [Flavobacteriaceae bacterium]